MSGPLHMVEMRLVTPALVRFLADHGLHSGHDDEMGYGLHAWLAAVFGKRAPKPFRLFAGKRGDILLGYTHYPPHELVEHARTFATPAALAACDLDALAGKSMPEKWAIGRRLGFEVLACPVSRHGKVEKDVFLRHVDDLRSDETASARDDVYEDWLRRRIADAARVEDVRLAGFRLARQLRRDRPGNEGARRLASLTRPHALFAGELTVTDSETFGNLLARGIGRHRAFGYGMLLLKAPE